MNIVAIGGGEIRKRETEEIDRFVVSLASARWPRVLFVPTASGDATGYQRSFAAMYGQRLGCRVENLLLWSRPSDRTEAAAKIRRADIVYVGGGNTLRMLRLWRRLGIDQHLAEAARKGAVMAGLSAGAIAWHEAGHSDSRTSPTGRDDPFIRVTGIGLRPGLFCPHLDAENRHESLARMVRRTGDLGIACDNGAAVWYRDRRAYVVATRKAASVHIYRGIRNGLAVDRFGDGYPLPLES